MKNVWLLWCRSSWHWKDHQHLVSGPSSAGSLHEGRRAGAQRFKWQVRSYQQITWSTTTTSICKVSQSTMSECCLCVHRGIDVVRNKIKMFAQQKVTLPKGRHKIIILDEADRWAGSCSRSHLKSRLVVCPGITWGGQCCCCFFSKGTYWIENGMEICTVLLNYVKLHECGQHGCFTWQ